MKKSDFLRGFSYATLALAALTFASCSDDDDDVKNVSTLEQDYFSIENAEYVAHDIPDATISEPLHGIDMSDQVMNGAMNYITVVTEQKVSKFFIGIKGVDGHFEYQPDELSAEADESYRSYVIPVMMSQTYTGNSTVVLSGMLENGDVTIPVENDLYYIETMPGAIEVKLAFSNSKDIDLHLYTPSGEHIYYANRGGIFTDELGNQISYGLDVDSNAGCYIDNINKENIYIPEELVEEGTYKVVVNMYSNCYPSIATNWSIVARYHGKLLNPVTGTNPVSGMYLVRAGNGDMTTVMTFEISNKGSKSKANIKSKWNFTPTPLTEADKNKIEFSMD